MFGRIKAFVLREFYKSFKPCHECVRRANMTCPPSACCYRLVNKPYWTRGDK